MNPGRIPSPTQTPGLFARVVAFVLSAVLLGLAFMFSLVALAVVAVGVTVLGGWLWWKTRALRKAIRQQAAAAKPAAGDFIEGEAVRTDDAPPLLSSADHYDSGRGSA